MTNRLVRKLESYIPISNDDQSWLANTLGPGRRILAKTDVILEGSSPRTVKVILDGWACRYRQLPNGRRQIVSLLLPGDVCDSYVFLLDKMDHTITTITAVLLAEISATAFQERIKPRTQLGAAFHRETLASAAIQREWTFNVGTRSGVERLAHLFCELHYRLTAVGLADHASYSLPLTQHDLAHALGQTSVHINRNLQDLRALGLITLRSRRLIIHDPATLARLAHFHPAYMHFTIVPDNLCRYDDAISELCQS